MKEMEENKIVAYKGFDENLCCRGFQYEIGKEYVQEGEIECCESGLRFRSGSIPKRRNEISLFA